MNVKYCSPLCSCQMGKGQPTSSLRKKDPSFTVPAVSPASAKVVSVNCGGNYTPAGEAKLTVNSFTVSCPFCGYFHRHGGGYKTDPIYYGSRGAHCQGGVYTIIPPT
jgi:hypothetical protein